LHDGVETKTKEIKSNQNGKESKGESHGVEVIENIEGIKGIQIKWQKNQQRL